MEYCPQCGKAISNNARFCSGCGKKIASQIMKKFAHASRSTPFARTRIMGNAPVQASKESALRIFVGPEYETVYRGKWREAAKQKDKTGWNWAAFIFQVFWLAYRKMYGMCALIIAFHAVETTARMVFRYSYLYGLIYGMVISIGLGMYGDNLYLKFSMCKTRKIMQTVPQRAWRNSLQKKGGTSIIAVVVVAAFIMAYFMIAFWIKCHGAHCSRLFFPVAA